MITITKQNDGVLFTFENSDKYLYGNGSILVPFNTLSIVADESDMITLRKSASYDIFLSARYDTDLGYRSKDEAVEALKGMLFAETGGGGSESGITSGEVQTMIDNSLEDYYTDDEVDAALSGKADTSALTAVANDVSTVSGQVATKVSISDFNTYSATTDARLAEDEEVTAAALNNLDENKQDALQYYSEDTEAKTVNIHIENTDDGTVGEVYVDGASVDISALRTEEDEDNGSMVETHSDINGNNAGIAMSYEKLVDDEEAAHSYLNVNEGLISMEVMANEETTNVDVYSTGVTINGENVVTEDQLSGYQPILSAGTGIEISGNVISATGGGGATYSAGTNISIDTANTINCTLPITANSTTFIAGSPSKTVNSNVLIGSTDLFSTAMTNSVTIGFGAKGGSSTVAIGQGATAGSLSKANDIAIGVSAKAQGGNFIAIGSNTNATGTTKMNLNNQIKVDTNNQVYIKDKTNTTDVCIQDAIAALGGLKLVKLTQAEYDALATKDANTLYIISNVVS